jgi:hypothetical protein
MNRSEFYRLAGSRLAEELEGEAELTALANSVIARVEPVPAVKLLCRPVRRIGESSSSEFCTNGRRSSRERWIARGRTVHSEVVHRD